MVENIVGFSFVLFALNANVNVNAIIANKMLPFCYLQALF